MSARPGWNPRTQTASVATKNVSVSAQPTFEADDYRKLSKLSKLLVTDPELATTLGGPTVSVTAGFSQ